MLFVSRFRISVLARAIVLTFAALAVLVSGCGDDPKPLASSADAASEVDATSSGDVAAHDGAAPKCTIDEACRQALAVGPCEEAQCIDGACHLFPRSEQMPCDDGNPCTEATRCDAGLCTHGFTVLCDDGNPCTTDECDPLIGCDFSPRVNASVCDDGDPCTFDDTCQEGECVGGLLDTCACDTTADCAAFDDDNLCNGNMHCVAGGCRLDATSQVQCPEAPDCYFSACVPATGECSTWPTTSGTYCDNGDPCSLGDTCEDGVCVPGEPICSCEQDQDCSAFLQPGFNLCLGPLRCVSGLCVPDAEEAIVCESAGPCLQVACQPDTGLCATTPVSDGEACDPGAACPTEGICEQGQCVASAPSCDDNDPCTQDNCQEDGTCSHEPFEGPCEDGDPCTTGETCADMTCGGGVPEICDDLNPCTQDACAPALGGCIFEAQPDGLACSSGDPCLSGGTCSAGECTGEQPTICDADGPCMTASCVSGEGCVQKKVENGLACTSDDPCQQEGVCQEGLCESLPVSCNDGNPCTSDQCDPEQGGCVHTNKEDGVACEAADPCMENSSCSAGLCDGGSPIQCEDGPCDTRTCDSNTGVCEIDEIAPNGTECISELPCQSPGVCESGSCEGAPPCPEDF